MLATAGALTAGALAIPLSRKILLGDIDHDWLAGELEFDRIEPDNKSVRVKSGSKFRVFRITGLAYDAKTVKQQYGLLDLRSSLVHALGEAGCTLRFFGIKRQHDISFRAEWPSPALQEIGEAERREFQSSYYVDWYLVISARSMKPLIDASNQVVAMLGEYRPALLERPEAPDRPCPLTGFINYLVCGELRRDLPAVSENISGNLPASDLSFDRESGLVGTQTPTQKLHKVIGIREWTEGVSGQLIASMMALPGDIEVSQICIPWDRELAAVAFKRKIMEQSTALIGNPALLEEYEAAQDMLSAGQTTVFHTQFQIIVRADTQQQLDINLGKIGSILGNKRIKFSIETAGAPIGWFNRMPSASNPLFGAQGLLRPLTLRNDNIAALWSLNHSPVGLMENPYDETRRPVRFLRSPTGQAYAFQFHSIISKDSPSLGNYLLFAPSGSGKSTLMLHLLGGLAKFDGVRSFIFDSKEGARFMVEAFGGNYQGYNDLQLNPLDVGEDTPEARQRIYTVLKSMSAGAELSDTDDEVLSHAVELAFKLDPPERTLDAIFEFAFARRTSLRRAFARWVTDDKGKVGLNAHVFNAKHDSLGSVLGSSHMVGINMNEALDDPVIGPPVVAHISQAIYRAAVQSKSGFNIFIDESAKLIENEGFLSLAVEMYREYRKLGGSVGMAFQDPEALYESGHLPKFLDNTSTLIFFPNANASEKTLAPFNLNDEQIGFILGGEFYERAENQRQVLIVKRDSATGFDESVILDVDLSSLGKCMRYYRAGKDANQHISALRSRFGDEWLSNL
jgi:type IV secretion system protein VirB4